MSVPIDQIVYAKDRERIIQTVIVFWVVGWFLKGYFLFPYVFGEVKHYPVLNSFFPEFFRNLLSLQFFYVFPLISLSLIFKRTKFSYGLTILSMLSSSAVLLLHQDTHNDATFVTSFWVALWLLWFINGMRRPDEGFLVHARSLALCLIAYIFWGGFVGKLTPEYWDGTVLTNIYLSQEPNMLNEFVRSSLGEAGVRWVFSWVSKTVIIAEGILALSPFWPYRMVLFLGIVFMLGISLFTTWRIFSVLLCLIGLLWALRPMNLAKKPL